MIPPAVITLVLLLRQISLAGTLAGMVLVYVGIYMSTAIFFITGFIRTIPHELEEAARVDGAGPFASSSRSSCRCCGPCWPPRRS